MGNKKLVVISILLCAFGLANVEMVLNDSIGNDPAKEKLCAARVTYIKGKMVTFEIDSDYVARCRRDNPDMTLIAIDDGNQNEYRIVVEPGSNTHLKLFVGSLADITSEVIPSSEVNQCLDFSARSAKEAGLLL